MPKRITLYVNNEPVLTYYGHIAPRLGYTVLLDGKEYEAWNIVEDRRTVCVALQLKGGSDENRGSKMG